MIFCSVLKPISFDYQQQQQKYVVRTIFVPMCSTKIYGDGENIPHVDRTFVRTILYGFSKRMPLSISAMVVNYSEPTDSRGICRAFFSPPSSFGCFFWHDLYYLLNTHTHIFSHQYVISLDFIYCIIRNILSDSEPTVWYRSYWFCEKHMGKMWKTATIRYVSDLLQNIKICDSFLCDSQMNLVWKCWFKNWCSVKIIGENSHLKWTINKILNNRYFSSSLLILFGLHLLNM